jgi:hypothetical protein
MYRKQSDAWNIQLQTCRVARAVSTDEVLPLRDSSTQPTFQREVECVKCRFFLFKLQPSVRNVCSFPCSLFNYNR